MGKLISSLLITLDGYVAGPNGELDMFKVDQEFFDMAGKLTEEADTALYGRATYQMMDSYWPDAGAEPGASKHDKEHSAWYNRVDKIVLSKSMNIAKERTKVISANVPEEIKRLKQEKERAIVIFGSPGAVYSLMQGDLIDEYWLFLAPVVIGNGIPFFKGHSLPKTFKLLSTTAYSSGITALHYSR